MDSIIQYYMEETEDMLQKAEECLIRLETDYSSVDINEMFRIAHTIKGSSYMVGYEDIGDIMHKIEDMLDCARNGSIMFEQNIVSLCFQGLDIVKKMLLYKKEDGSQEMMGDISEDASRIKAMIEAFVMPNKKEEVKIHTKQPAKGIVSTLLSKKPKGRNKFYISFFIEEDAPMVSPVFMMILKNVEDIGTLVYSSITDRYFSESSNDQEIKTLDIILNTDIEEAELYTYFTLSYVERINIVDLTRSKLAENDYYFKNSNDTFFFITLKVFINLYNILFNESKDVNKNNEKLSLIESLHLEAINACDSVKNKNNISSFMNDLHELFSFIINMYNHPSPLNEDLYSNIRERIIKLTERAYNYTKGKYLFRVFKSGKRDFINRLNNFMQMVDMASTIIILIDLSNLEILHENEVKALIELKKQMEAKNIEIGIIAAEGTSTRKIINIFDSIRPLAQFNVFRSELDAIIGMLYSQDSFPRIINILKDV